MVKTAEKLIKARSPELLNRPSYTVMISDTATPISDDLEGAKGSKLRLMYRWGLPIPPGFIIRTTAFQEFKRSGSLPNKVQRSVDESIVNLESQTGCRLGDSENPLFVSVRSGAKFSMPGAMETILNVGITEETLPALAKKIGLEQALASYLELIKDFSVKVFYTPQDRFDALSNPLLEQYGVSHISNLPAAELRNLIDKAKATIEQKGHFFPQDPKEQIRLATLVVCKSWYSQTAKVARLAKNIPENLGTAVTVQEMVFGNRKGYSGSLVLLTRDTMTFNGPVVDLAMNCQGTATVDDASIIKSIPLENLRNDLSEELRRFITILGEHFERPQEVEVTFYEKADGSLVIKILQTRDLANLSALATFRFFRERYQTRQVPLSTILREIPTEYLNQLLTKLKAVDMEKSQDAVLAKGCSLSPVTRETARLATSIRQAQELSTLPQPIKVILVASVSREEIYQIAKIENIVGLVATNGALGTHLARVAEEQLANKMVVLLGTRVDTKKLEEGSQITADGTSGYVFKGEPAYKEEKVPSLSPDEERDAITIRDAKWKNPWQYVIPEFDEEDQERAASLAALLHPVESLKAQETVAVQARFPQSMRLEWSVAGRDVTNRELKDLIMYSVGTKRVEEEEEIRRERPSWATLNVSVRTAVPTQGSSPWAAVTNPDDLYALFNPTEAGGNKISSRAAPENGNGQTQTTIIRPKIEQLRSQPNLAAFLIGTLPAGNTSQTLEFLHCAWNLAVDRNGKIYLNVYPHTSNVRIFNNRELAKNENMVTFVAQYDPRHPGFLEPSQALVGANLTQDSLAIDQATYVMKTVFKKWWGSGLGFAMAEMAVMFPNDKYSTPSAEGLARKSTSQATIRGVTKNTAIKALAERFLPGVESVPPEEFFEEWCQVWGINADPKNQE